MAVWKQVVSNNGHFGRRHRSFLMQMFVLVLAPVDIPIVNIDPVVNIDPNVTLTSSDRSTINELQF